MNEQVNQLVMNADLAAMPGEALEPAAEQLQRKQRLAHLKQRALLGCARFDGTVEVLLQQRLLRARPRLRRHLQRVGAGRAGEEQEQRTTAIREGVRSSGAHGRWA